MFKLFGIPNCDTVKKARVFFQAKNVEIEFVDFKKYRPSEEDIERWSKSFGSLPVNSKGVTYKKHKEQYESLNLKDQISFLQNNTSMIKRPILENGGKVLAFGFDESAYNKILN